jgi:putative protease
MSDPPRPELLAPAGDRETLRAAAANGADAVYFGLREFNARLRAANFGVKELPEVMRFLHDRNVRGYVTFNTLVFPGELPRAAELLAAIARAGADAVIVQDLGVARLVRRLAPALPVHASTQMTLTEPRGMALVEGLGVTRALLARELPLEVIGRIAKATGLALEVFVHGALCISFSGQCLASLSMGGRSANRGVCAQACRLPYRLVVDGTPRPEAPAHLLSPRDLAAHDRIADLVRLGVLGFKIEGRLKGAAYVAAATRAYRTALDAAMAGRPAALPADRLAELEQSFSRGFSRGFLDGPDHGTLVDARSPRHRGIRVGTVTGKSKDGLLVALDPGASLKPGDGIVIDEGRPEWEVQGGRVYAVAPAGSGRRAAAAPPGTVEVRFGRDDVNVAVVKIGSAVWRTDDPAMRRRLEGTFARDTVARRVPLTVRVRARLGEPLHIIVRDDAGRETEAVWDHPLARADRHPLTVELLREQFGRLGDTPFELAGVEAEALDPVMVPKSVLNDLRRRAVEQLAERRREEEARALADPDALGTLRVEARARRPATAGTGPVQLHVLVRTAEQLDAVLGGCPAGSPSRPASVWCDFADPRRHREAVARARAAGMPAGVATLRILMPGEEGLLEAAAGARPDAVLVRNPGALAWFRERAPEIPIVADHSLNAANELTADLLASWGARRVAPAYDLAWDRLQELLAQADSGFFEVVIHRHTPMFHTAHCLYAAALSGGRGCRDCPRPCDAHRLALEDRLGVRHPVAVDAAGRNTVFHGTPVSWAESVAAMRAAGVRHARVELLEEDAAGTRDVVEGYARVLAGLDDGRALRKRLRAMRPPDRS